MSVCVCTVLNRHVFSLFVVSNFTDISLTFAKLHYFPGSHFCNPFRLFESCVSVTTTQQSWMLFVATYYILYLFICWLFQYNVRSGESLSLISFSHSLISLVRLPFSSNLWSIVQSFWFVLQPRETSQWKNVIIPGVVFFFVCNLNIKINNIIISHTWRPRLRQDILESLRLDLSEIKF